MPTVLPFHSAALSAIVFPEHLRPTLAALPTAFQDVFASRVHRVSFENLRRRPTLLLLVLQLVPSARVQTPDELDLVLRVAIEASPYVGLATLRAFFQQPALPWADLRLWLDADLPRAAVVRVLFAHLAPAGVTASSHRAELAHGHQRSQRAGDVSAPALELESILASG